MQKPYLIVSDIHLGAVPSDTERRFRAFLAHAAEVSSGLLIDGDLFDFWFEYRTVVPRKHYRVLAALRDVVEAGVPITFVGGNHDAWAGDFLRDEVGLAVLDGPVELSLAGRRALVTHGDAVGTGDLGYRALRRVLRNRWTTGAFRLLHPDLGARIADRVSSTEEKAAGADAARSRAEHIREWAMGELRRHPELELIVSGHAHHPELVRVEGNRWFVNAGDWIHHDSYVVLPPAGGAPELRSWPRD